MNRVVADTQVETYELKVIARIHTDLPEKFGLPRQSGLIPELQGRIVFEPAFRSVDAVRGLDGYSHLWLIWQFSQAVRDTWSPLVRPPRLGGNEKMGVFATRSPFRPNAIGLSCVELEKVELDRELGPVIYVRGVDLMDGTPIFDIKPYLPYADSYPEAVGGWTNTVERRLLDVECGEEWLTQFSSEQREALLAVLANDPRPRYQDDPQRVYGLSFAGRNVKFRVEGETVHVTEVEKE